MMWAELLFFAVVLGIAVQQLYSVKKAQRKTAEEEAARAARDATEQTTNHRPEDKI